ncbi:MAG: TolC family protein [Proteobacteria bacterium]|nr:TolC family protein [Pseudomonadota bacterium]
MRYLLIAILIFAPLSNICAKTPKEQEIINSVLRFYPKILQEEQNIAVSQANYLSKKGAFDAKITASKQAYEDGFYDDRYYDEVKISKPLPFANSEIFTSYSKSSGEEYPLDNESDNTLSDGRAKIGFSISLLRGFLTNENLTELKASNLDISINKEKLRLTQLSIINSARKAYYNYVNAKQLYDIALDIVNLRKERLEQVQAQSNAGDKPKIYVTDSKRSLIKSQSELIDSKQNLQSAAFKLSIYYRDHQGNKIDITQQDSSTSENLDLEKAVNILKHDDVEEQIAKIKQERADIRILNLKIKQEEQYLKLGKNQFLPELDFNFAASKDFGDDIESPASTNLKRDERLNFGINLSIPLQTNKQKGLTSKSRAKIQSLRMKKLLTQDSIEIDVKTTYNQIINLIEIYNNLKQEVEMSQILLNAEKERFKNGDSDIITINIREQDLFLSKEKMLKYLNKILSLIADYDLLLMKDI